MRGSVMEGEAWTNERLDDLNHRVDLGFRETREEIRGLRAEVGGLRSEMGGLRSEMYGESKALRAEMGKEFAAVRSEMREEFTALRAEMRDGLEGLRGELQTLNGNFAAQQRTMVQFAGVVVAANIGGFLGVIAAILTVL